MTFYDSNIVAIETGNTANIVLWMGKNFSLMVFMTWLNVILYLGYASSLKLGTIWLYFPVTVVYIQGEHLNCQCPQNNVYCNVLKTIV